MPLRRLLVRLAVVAAVAAVVGGAVGTARRLASGRTAPGAIRMGTYDAWPPVPAAPGHSAGTGT